MSSASGVYEAGCELVRVLLYTVAYYEGYASGYGVGNYVVGYSGYVVDGYATEE